ncbi:UNVERIFIED_CONTAM: hypothetical protein NCL1_18204 [Trichonephila clavipes]
MLETLLKRLVLWEISGDNLMRPNPKKVGQDNVVQEPRCAHQFLAITMCWYLMYPPRAVTHVSMRRAILSTSPLMVARGNRCQDTSTAVLRSSTVFGGIQICRVCRLGKHVKSSQAVKSSRPSIVLLENLVDCSLQQGQNNRLHNLCDITIPLSNGRQYVPEASYDQTLCHPKP